MVSHPCGDHARSCLTTAFKSKFLTVSHWFLHSTCIITEPSPVTMEVQEQSNSAFHSQKTGLPYYPFSYPVPSHLFISFRAATIIWQLSIHYSATVMHALSVYINTSHACWVFSYRKGDMGSFSMHNDFNVCCAHEGKTGIDICDKSL